MHNIKKKNTTKNEIHSDIKIIYISFYFYFFFFNSIKVLKKM